MNLHAFLNRGAAHAPSEEARHQAVINRTLELTRKTWLNALLVDQTRAWLSIGTHEPGVLEGLATMLTIAGFVQSYDAGTADTPECRVIRGGVSAATQCVRAGGIVTRADATAFASACKHATDAVQAGSLKALLYAAQEIRRTVGM